MHRPDVPSRYGPIDIGLRLQRLPKAPLLTIDLSGESVTFVFFVLLIFFLPHFHTRSLYISMFFSCVSVLSAACVSVHLSSCSDISEIRGRLRENRDVVVRLSERTEGTRGQHRLSLRQTHKQARTKTHMQRAYHRDDE